MRKITYPFSVFLIFFFLFSARNATAQGVYDPLYPFHPQTSLNFTSSNLPIVVINLDERMADKSEDRRVNADMVIISRTDGSRNSITDTVSANHSNDSIINYAGKIGIKYRGNSSYNSSDKKPFGLKTQNASGGKVDADILGMGADSDWALLAPYSDRSMIRDVLIFDLCRGYLEYVPTGKYCEVVLNGVYQGVYIMTARVRRGKNRINIPKPGNSGDNLTGGYILEIDRNDEPVFQSEHNYLDVYGNPISGSHYFQYTYPDIDDYNEGMTAQQNYIINRMKHFENVMASDSFADPVKGYRAQIDVMSVIDYILAQEISHNVDGYRLSTNIYKYRDSHDPRFKMSIWDFNITLGNSDYCDGWSTEGWAWDLNKFSEPQKVPFWFHHLLNDETFRKELRERWFYYRQTNLNSSNVTAKIDSLVQLLTEAEARNTQIWNRWGSVLWPNYYISNNWANEISFLKDWVNKRLQWMDRQLIPFSENLVANASFDSDHTRGPSNNNIFLSNWKTNNSNAGLSSTVKLNGRYSLSFRNRGEAWQPVTKIENGKYTFKAWVRTVGDPKGSVIIRKYNSSGEEKTQSVKQSESFYEIVIEDIEVDKNLCEIAFKADFTTGGTTRLYVDSVSLFRQKDENYAYHPENDVDLPESKLPIVVVAIPEKMTGNQADADMAIIDRSDDVANRLADLKKSENLTNPNIIPYIGNIGFSVVSDGETIQKIKILTKDPDGNLLNTSLLNLPTHNEWVLLPLFDDPSLLHSVTSDLLSQSIVGYSLSGAYCNLVINEIYQGIYQLAIPLTDQLPLNPPGETELEISASYGLTIGDDTGDGFRSDWKNQDLFYETVNDYSYYSIFYPQEISQNQQDYIETRIQQFENMMTQDITAQATGYRNYIDTISAANFILLQELFRNPDAYNSNITLFNTMEQSRFQFINMCPVIPGKCQTFESYATEGWAWNSNRLDSEKTVPFWIKRLVADEPFLTLLGNQWETLRNGVLSDENICAVIDKQQELLAADQPYHFRLDISGKYADDFYYQGNNWNDEVDYLKAFLLQRAAWMDSQLLPDLPENVIVNHSFEIDDHTGLTVEKKLSGWQYEGNGIYSEEASDGNHAFELGSNSSLYQTVTELTPGNYTFKAKIQSDGGELIFTIYHPENVIVINHPVNSSAAYQEITIEDISVLDGVCKIEIKNGQNTMLIDDVWFYCTSKVGIENDPVSQQKEVKVYPNPFNQHLVFEYLPKTNKQNIAIYSITGLCLYRFDVSSTENVPVVINKSLNANLPSGIYFYQIRDGNSVYSGKVVKN
ncbi:CotH kinase family protein [Bacteroidales bacterium OttesenSCG-928-B11]|nr:CotH kinase family protein [Bacteroidales bacterium OttesenSCG-928-C03]MDL2311444.1 CotH kinase family protein [Bacteroidales bacterium OttesenSCG-928-B11]